MGILGATRGPYKSKYKRLDYQSNEEQFQTMNSVGTVALAVSASKSGRNLKLTAKAMLQKAANIKEMGKLKLSEAAHTTQKNSRTITKICQLQEILEKTKSTDDFDLITRKIEHLKQRVSRRLGKLAKWADAPISDELLESSRSARSFGSSNVVSRR